MFFNIPLAISQSFFLATPLHEVQSCVQQWTDSVVSYNPNKVMKIPLTPWLQNTQHSSKAPSVLRKKIKIKKAFTNPMATNMKRRL